MKRTENNTIDEKIKKGCLFPIYSILFAILLMILSIVMLRCEGPNSQDAEEDRQLEEMVQYHRSENRYVIVFD